MVPGTNAFVAGSARARMMERTMAFLACCEAVTVTNSSGAMTTESVLHSAVPSSLILTLDPRVSVTGSLGGAS